MHEHDQPDAMLARMHRARTGRVAASRRDLGFIGWWKPATITAEAVLMMNKKKVVDIKADVAALLHRLPGKSPEAWLAKEIESARRDPSRDVETLEMLCAALEREVTKRRKPKPRGRPAKS